MPVPWERYQQPAQPQGPWARYQQQPKQKPMGAFEVARAALSPTQRVGLGAGEAALSIGTGMVAAPLNYAWNAGMEALELPTGQPVGTYQPRTQEGQAMLGGVDKAMRLTGVPQALEAGMDLDNPDPGVRATGNLMGAAAGFLPAFGAVRASRLRRASIPTRTEIKAASGEAYQAARSTGEMLPQSGFNDLIQRAEKMLSDEAFDPSQQPRTLAALNRLYEEGSRPGISGFSPQGAEVIRRHLMNAEDAAISDIRNPAVSASADSRLAGKLLDDFDDFMERELSKSGPEYQKARSLWSIQLKSAEIERLFERAKNQAGQFSMSGMENALRTQFKQLADNPRRFRRFNAEERTAILKVVRGGPVQYALRLVGKFAPTGVVPGIAALSAESAAPGAGFALAGAGIAGRAGASALRNRAAGAVDELVRSGATNAMGARLTGQPLPQLGYLPSATLGTEEAKRKMMAERLQGSR